MVAIVVVRKGDAGALISNTTKQINLSAARALALLVLAVDHLNANATRLLTNSRVRLKRCTNSEYLIS